MNVNVTMTGNGNISINTPYGYSLARIA
jgi:hypothetical protein